MNHSSKGVKQQGIENDTQKSSQGPRLYQYSPESVSRSNPSPTKTNANANDNDKSLPSPSTPTKTTYLASQPRNIPTPRRSSNSADSAYLFDTTSAASGLKRTSTIALSPEPKTFSPFVPSSPNARTSGSFVKNDARSSHHQQQQQTPAHQVIPIVPRSALKGKMPSPTKETSDATPTLPLKATLTPLNGHATEASSTDGNGAEPNVAPRKSFSAIALANVPDIFPSTREEPSPTELDRALKNIKNRKFDVGELVNVIDSTWLEKFLFFAERPHSGDAPGVIDNESLLLREGINYSCITTSQFYQLTKWYGLKAKHHVILGICTSEGDYTGATIDMKPLKINVFRVPNNFNSDDAVPDAVIVTRHATTPRQVKLELSNVMDIALDSFRLWALTKPYMPTDPFSLEPIKWATDSWDDLIGHAEATNDVIVTLKAGIEYFDSVSQTWPIKTVSTFEESEEAVDSMDADGIVDEDSESPPPLLEAPVAAERKETLDEKRLRIQRRMAGETSTNDTESKGEPLRLTAAEPGFIGPSIPVSAMSSSIPSYTPPRPSFSLPVGATGLNNLGNTCFMNSALQCLSNTVNLTNFFLSDRWMPELNKDNPLGMNGEVAESYAHLVHMIWRANEGRQNSVAPRQFKSTIGRFNPTFVGYSQQDSQELLQFLLDGLHEDLNRIKKKPYIEAPDMDGWSDEDIAAKSWEIYRARNDSAIVDLFQGEYKSRVECLDCGKWSVKFDPYMFLSLPVPETRTTTISLTAVPASKPQDPTPAREKHRSLSIVLPRDATIQTLKQKLAERMGWEDSSSKKVMVLEMWHKKIYKIFDDWDRVAEIGGTDDIFAYELGEPDWDRYQVPQEHRTFANTVHIPVFLKISGWRNTTAMYGSRIPDVDFSNLFGIPVIVALPADIHVCVYVNEHVARLMSEEAVGQAVVNQLGRLLYSEVVRAIRRFAVMGLYRPFELPEITGDTLMLELQRELERELEAEKLAESAQPPAESSERPSEQPFTKLRSLLQVAGHGNVTDIDNLFALKYIQGSKEANVSAENKAFFYSTTAAKGHASTGSFYPPRHPVIHVPQTETVTEIVDENSQPPATADDDQSKKAEDPAGDPEEFPDLAQEFSRHTKRTQYREEIVYTCPVQTEDYSVPLRNQFSMRGELLAVAEFSNSQARLVFGDDVVGPAYGQSVGGLFKAEPDQEPGDGAKAEPAQTRLKKQITLQDCLNEFMKEEIMGDDDTWYCPRCKEHKKIKKKLDIWSVPETLVFHLKRFSNTGRGFRSMSANKIDALVDAPINGLDLTDLILGRKHAIQHKVDGADADGDDRLIYDLYAVSNHFGGLGGGHYTAYAKNGLDNQWYNFDDSHVSKTSEDSVMTPAAYLLFYQRRTKKADTSLAETIEALKNKPVPEPAAHPGPSFPGTGYTLGGGRRSSVTNYGSSSLSKSLYSSFDPPPYIPSPSISSNTYGTEPAAPVVAPSSLAQLDREVDLTPALDVDTGFKFSASLGSNGGDIWDAGEVDDDNNSVTVEPGVGYEDLVHDIHLDDDYSLSGSPIETFNSMSEKKMDDDLDMFENVLEPLVPSLRPAEGGDAEDSMDFAE
ncbi:CSN-associated deubiquitinating enzyme Ubp12 [Chytridiales sp. JEL 0842]|nr:CSN-associated deubiquitinating enzyme Ubp12 [Chytridiales sp. JEL 0842]